MSLKSKYSVFLIPVLVFSLNAQTADLILQDEITPTYIAYLVGKEAGWLLQVTTGIDDTPTMQAHMGLAIMAFAWSHIDGDTMITELDPIMESIGTNLDTLAGRIGSDIIPMLETMQMNAFLTALTDFFDSGDYAAFRDFMSQTADSLGNDFDNFGITIDEFFGDVGDNFADQNFSSHLDSIFSNSADFDFSLQVLGSEFADTTFIFSRTFFDHLEDIEAIGDSMSTDFDQFGSWMDSVMSITGGDVMPGIAHFQDGLYDLTKLLDTIRVVITSQPFAPFEIDPSPIDSIQMAIDELDSLLDGKEYEYNSDYEGYSIRPLAIIQNMPGDGLPNIYWDFYRSLDPPGYTFGGIFPYGLDPQSLDLLSADMIMNDWDDIDVIETRLSGLELLWQTQLSQDSTDSDAHLGIAMVQSFNIINDHLPIFDDIFRLLDEGRIDSLTYLYDWESVNFMDDLDDVDYHLDFYTNADEPAHFVILIKTIEDAYGPYEIGPNSEFEILNVSVPTVAMAQMNMNLARTGLDLAIQGISEIYAELGDIFVLELDPTILDFSNIESDSDLVLLLEQSNPNFLSLTPYGVDKFIAAGDALEEGFGSLHNFFTQMVTLAYAMQPYENDFDMDGLQFIMDMEEMEEHTFEVWQDFAIPDAVTIIDSERVNLSAWFDNPPASFLIMWKDLVFGIDSTMGGLFPNRPYVAIGSGTTPTLPRSFEVHDAYPNPFNPVTLISFDIPRAGNVNVTIYNLLGEQVAALVDGKMTAGWKRIPWNAGNLPSGIYFYRVRYDRQTFTNKLMYIK